MKHCTFLFCFVNSSVVLCFLASSVTAQIIPDTTLPNNSKVTSQGNTNIIIGGTRAGSNLFHSFEQFSVSTGGTVFFNNTLDIQNIISRVTGSSISNIDGLIKTNGTANLFLINPNGIIFGPNASLQIGGSFLGTTASSINFADGTQFSAKIPQATPLLTISVPVGLQFGENPGVIQVQGPGHNLIDSSSSPIKGAGSSSTGLRVQLGNTLALVGGDVNLKGGILTAPGGRIELSSVGGGSVNLNSTPSGWTFGYQGVSNFKDINLSQRALADASGVDSGSIQVQAAHINLTDGAVILIQNQGEQSRGKLSVNAADSLGLSGTSPNGNIASSLRTQSVGTGNGGDIAVSTKQLVLQEGGGIVASTFSNAKGGNLIVNASESTQLLGFSPLNPSITSNISALTNAFDSGKAGDVTVSTGQLTATSGGFVASSTLGAGAGGSVLINANSIKLTGVNQNNFGPSALDSSAFNVGSAGPVTINTANLTLGNGGRIGSSTIAYGNAGSVIINASDSVEVSGTVPSSLNPSTISSSANITDPIARAIFKTPLVPSGASGDVTINTKHLAVTNGGLINVRNDGPLNAGTLTVNARSIFLDSKGGFTASTASGEGGNILLNAQNLQLRHNSPITASAGGSGKGGNITINTGTLAALENSPIIADAYQGRGGNIQINAQGIFRSPDSAITASSRLGINGTVQINTPYIDLARAAGIPVTPPQSPQLGSVCSGRSGSVGSSLVYAGTGGTPPSSSDPLSSSTGWHDNSLPTQVADNLRTTEQVASQPGPFTPVTGWIIHPDGTMNFTYDAAGSVPYSSTACHQANAANK